MVSRIEDYALIGDLSTAALVGRDGSLDWLCWPRFDSDACFAALLGTVEHGRWQIAPPSTAHASITRRYRPEHADPGDAFRDRRRRGDPDRLHAAARAAFAQRHLHSCAWWSASAAASIFRSELVLRFGYGANVPWVTRIDDTTLRAIAGPDMVVLRSPVPMHGENFKTVGDFMVEAGERLPFVLSYARSHEPLPAPVDAEEALTATEEFWTGWARKNQIAGPWNEAVCRSLITLKALTYAPTGGMVAAPTTSLPEQIGGPRNWDYRYCWLRDATLTLLALMNAGYFEEARAWRDWLLRAAAGSPEPDADHVRHPRRAAADRMGSALAAGL